jgi:hypothetical protein
VDPRAGFDTEARRKILSPLPGIEPHSHSTHDFQMALCLHVSALKCHTDHSPVNTYDLLTYAYIHEQTLKDSSSQKDVII